MITLASSKKPTIQLSSPRYYIYGEALGPISNIIRRYNGSMDSLIMALKRALLCRAVIFASNKSIEIDWFRVRLKVF